MSRKLWIIVFALLLIGSIIGASLIGAVSISFSDFLEILFSKQPTDQTQRLSSVWFNIRLPRILLAIAIGGGLSLAGAALQGLFRNPLADPSIIGISGGAVAMAAITIVAILPLISQFPTFANYSVLSITTFIGAVGAAFLIFALSRKQKKTNVATMLLAGIALNAVAGAITGLLTFFANDDQLRDLTFWTMGSLAGANYNNLVLVASTLILAGVLLIPNYKAFNALALGEHEAQFLGTETEKLKVKVIIATALMVGVGVAFTGMIIFVGLVVPHILRLILGNNYKYIFWSCLFLGGALLNITDTIARVVVQPAELPIGVITALIGAPIFLMLLLKNNNRKLA